MKNTLDKNTWRKASKPFAALMCGLILLAIPSLVTAGAESGPYIGASIGQASLDFSKDDVDFDDDDTAFKIFAGYNFGVIPLIDLAVEGSYVDFGEASSIEILDEDVGVTGLDVFGLAGFKLGPIGLFAKVGWIFWDSKSDAIQRVLDDSGGDMAYGIGLRFQIGSLALRAEYELFEIDIVDVGYYSVGAAWTF